MSNPPGARTPQSPPPSHHPNRPHWRWRTFPVFAAFVGGLLIAAIANGEPNNAAAAILVWVAVIGCSYALAHFLVVRLLLPRRARSRERASEDDQYEDVVVYPNE